MAAAVAGAGDDGIAAGPAGRRGAADARAFRLRYHNRQLHQQLTPAEPEAKYWFDAFEQARVEALGSRQFPGAAHNLRRYRTVQTPGQDGAVPDAAVLARLRAALADEPPSTSPMLATAPGQAPDPAHSLPTAALHELVALRDDQARFARCTLALIRQLLERFADTDAAGLPNATDAGQAADDDPDSAAPDAPAAAQEATVSAAESAADKSGDEIDDETDGEEPQTHDLPAAVAEATAGLTEPADGHDRDGDEAAWIVGPPADGTAESVDGYRVFTRRYDRTLAATQLASPPELAVLRRRLDTYIDLQGQIVQRLANRLYRRLLARQRRSWQFDEPEGELDSARLARLITDPLQPLVFRREQEGAYRDTTVTLLLDNSRSMLGRPILVAAACADILARTLERCGVSVEVLGFTTASLDGGESARQWQAAGRPPAPGRISDLRHIVYKAASQPWRRARAGFGLMLKPELLNQNVDGEALQWACERLQRRPASRRLLLVISDGAPVDVSTQAANHEEYLAAHLRRVIAGIEAQAAVDLLAIGIGHDVRGWYRRAIRIADTRDLGRVLVEELMGLFEG